MRTGEGEERGRGQGAACRQGRGGVPLGRSTNAVPPPPYPLPLPRSKSRFFEDPQVDPLFRATLEAYKDSGYDRGHMVGVEGGRGGAC